MGEEMEEDSSYYSVISYPGSKLPAEYINLILSAWLRSYKYGNDYFKLINPEAYFSAYKEFIYRILNNPSTIVRLAVLTDTVSASLPISKALGRDAVVIGWSVCRDKILDYVYVNAGVRDLKIGISLIPKDIQVITHLTHKFMSIWQSKYPEVIFNPFV